jgi:hypothetical protein
MRTYALVFFIFPFFACAREMTVGQLPSPPYLDTEVMWIGGSVTNYLPVSYKQSFDMTQSGNLRVSKFELWAERNIFNERNVSEGVSRFEQGR